MLSISLTWDVQINHSFAIHTVYEHKYLSLVSSEDLCPGAQLVWELCPVRFNRRWVTQRIKDLFIKGNIVGGPVASSKDVSLVTALYVPDSADRVNMTNTNYSIRHSYYYITRWPVQCYQLFSFARLLHVCSAFHLCPLSHFVLNILELKDTREWKAVDFYSQQGPL